MEKQFMTIDGIRVELNGEKTVLQVIRKAGIDMPTLCYHPDLSIYGACRLCMFENERGGLDAACSAQPRDGMVIRTNTARLRKYRKNIIELLLANHCVECPTCPKSGSCKLQELAERYDVKTVRFPNTAKMDKVDKSSLSIDRDGSKCVLCGKCVRMCNEVQAVGAINFANRGSKMYISTMFDEPIANTACVGCGQCAAVCPVGAITIKQDTSKVWDAIADKNTNVTVQVAPAVRVAVTEQFHMQPGTDVMGKIVAALHQMGVDKVYDTSVGADMTILEETAEFVEHLGKNTGMPLFTSCCPGWIRFAETKYPEIMPFISTCRSPMHMLSEVILEHEKDNGMKNYNIAIMPCTAKKFEAARDEFKHGDQRNVDCVLSTQELIHMIKTAGVDFEHIAPEAVDMPFGQFSGAGVIFGATGGVTEAVLRRVSSDKSNNAIRNISYCGVRGLEGIKEFTVPFGEGELRIAVVSGLGNAAKLIDKLLAKEVSYDFVEIMACPGGCVNGGGQPVPDDNARAIRSEGLYSSDKTNILKTSDTNPLMDKIYADFVKGRNHELLHVHYGKHNG